MRYELNLHGAHNQQVQGETSPPDSPRLRWCVRRADDPCYAAGAGHVMRWFGHLCAAACLLCAANIASSFVDGGPVIGNGAVSLMQLVVILAGGVAPMWFHVTASQPRPR